MALRGNNPFLSDKKMAQVKNKLTRTAVISNILHCD